MKSSTDKSRPRKRFGDARPQKSFAGKPGKGSGSKAGKSSGEKPGKAFGERAGKRSADRVGKRQGKDDLALRSPRTRTYHREDHETPTSGFDKGSRAVRTLEPPPPNREDLVGPAVAPPASERVDDAEPKPVSPQDPVELVLTVPAGLMRRLEAHAAELGVEVQPLVRVWLSDKLRN